VREATPGRVGGAAGIRPVGMALLGVLLVLSLGCSPKAPPQSGTPAAARPGAMPSALTDLESHAEDIYDVAASASWQKAAAAYTWFEQGMRQLDAQVQGQEDRKAKLRSQVDQLGAAIKSKDKQQACVAANELSWQASQMTVAYGPTAPLALARLDYDGRRLQIWAGAHHAAKLVEATTDIRQTWMGVRREVVRHGGMKQAQAFDGVMSKLGTARTPEAYRSVATQMLDQVDNLESVFASTGSG
jgi:hypothetical protein